MAQKRRSIQDPFAEREAQKYDKPIASRELILQMLAEQGMPMTLPQIAQAFGLEDEESLEAITRRLRAMERDGQLVRNRRGSYGPVSRMDLIAGRIIGHPDGFGFLVPDDGGDDLFMSAKQMRALIHGDRVVACVAGIDRRGRREGSVVEVLERKTQQVVGRFHSDRGTIFVVPDNKRITHDILVPATDTGGATDGQMVVVAIVEQPDSRRPPIGRVVEVLGDHMAPGMEIDVSIRAHDLPNTWPQAVREAVSTLSREVPEVAKQGREDIRHVPLVTIDGPDARDFDDAVYCERQGRGWRLLVAIADVAHYVDIDSALDGEARNRGNSVYFPGRVIPMLPEELSNGLCSINPEVDRLCMVCEMSVTTAGKVKSHRFFEGVMRSHARLIYEDVAAMLADKAPNLQKKYQHLLPHLRELHALFQAFLGQRAKRGAIDFETTETRIVFGADRKIERIVPTERNDAHRMIEECMIAANVAAADFLLQHEMPTVFRVHDLPKQERLADLRTFLGELGLKLGGGEKPEAGHYAKLLASVRERPDAHLIQTVMLRSLNQAVYHPDNLGHFGLALEGYAHFTSPIRRYPDLLVHRAIRHLLRNKKASKFRYSHADMLQLGEHCSFTERRADEATRDATDWLKCEYMLDKVGQSFDGIITSVTSFGLFVELNDIYIEGLVHVTALGNEYFHFDPVKHRMVGERSRTIYRLADKVRVRVVRVDLDDRKIDFDLGESVSGDAAKPARTRGRGGRDRSPPAADIKPKESGGEGDGGKRKRSGKRRARKR